MPNIPDSQNIVSGDGRRKVSNTGESYITEGLQSVAKSIGHIAEQELKIENDRETKSTVQQAHAKHNYIKQSYETYSALANDPDFVNWDVNEIKQKWDELEVKRRSSVVEGVNFYASGSQDVLFAEFDAQNQEQFGQLLELHSQGVDTQAADLWVGVTNKLSGQIQNNPSSESLFGAIYELQAQGEKLSSSLGVVKMQTVLRNTTADLIKSTILSLIEKKQFEDAQALLLGEWVDPITRNETNFDNLLGMDTKIILGELIGKKWREADELDVQGLVQAVNRGEAGLKEIAVFRTNNLISKEQTLDLTERVQQVDLERQETQRRTDLVQSSLDNGVRLNTNIPDNKRAVDERYENTVNHPDFSKLTVEDQNNSKINFMDRTGIAPTQVRRSLRQDRKGSPKNQVRAADLFVKALDLDFNVFPDVQPFEAARLLLINQGIQAGKTPVKAIEDAQQTIKSLTSEQSGTSEHTYSKLFPNGGPYAPGDVNSSISLEDFVASSINNYTSAGAAFMSDEAKETLASELNTQFQKLFRLTGDSNLAQDYAEQVVRRDWNPTDVKGILEYVKKVEAENSNINIKVANPDHTNSDIELEKYEKEFEKEVQEKIVLPEGSTVLYVEDEQTSLDEKETGKPSYKIVVKDKDGNIVDGPISMRRLPGEPNEPSYIRYVPGVGVVADSFKLTRIVSGSPGQGYVDASGRVTRSVKNIPNVGFVNTKNYNIDHEVHPVSYVASDDMIKNYENTIGRIRNLKATSDHRKPTEEEVSSIIIDNYLRTLWAEMVGNKKGDEYGEKGYILFHQTVFKHLDKGLLKFNREPKHLGYELDKLTRKLGKEGFIPSIEFPEKYGKFFSNYTQNLDVIKLALDRVLSSDHRPSISTIQESANNLEILQNISAEELSLIDNILDEQGIPVVDETRVLFYQLSQNKLKKIDEEIIGLKNEIYKLDELRINQPDNQILNDTSEAVKKVSKRINDLNSQKSNTENLYNEILINQEVQDRLWKIGEKSVVARGGNIKYWVNKFDEGRDDTERNNLGGDLVFGFRDPVIVEEELGKIDIANFRTQKLSGIAGVLGSFTKVLGEEIDGTIVKVSGGGSVALVSGATAVAVGNLTPLVVFPEEIITVPGAMYYGYKVGSEISELFYNFKQNTGKIYLSIRDASQKDTIVFDDASTRLISIGMGTITTLIGKDIDRFGGKAGKYIAQVMSNTRILEKIINVSTKFFTDALSNGSKEAVLETLKIVSEIVHKGLQDNVEWNRKEGDDYKDFERIVDAVLNELEKNPKKTIVQSILP